MSQDANIGLSPENLEKLEGVGKELDQATMKLAAAEADPCGWYKIAKPILKKALPFIKLIPKWGKQVAAAIEKLMEIADGFCPS